MYPLQSHFSQPLCGEKLPDDRLGVSGVFHIQVDTVPKGAASDDHGRGKPVSG